MYATIEIDDDLLKDAQEATGLTDVSAIVHLALEALVEKMAARQLARLGSSPPEAE